MHGQHNVNIHLLSHLAHFFLEWETFKIKVGKKFKVHISFWVTFFFRKSCRLSGKHKKYRRAGQATNDNIAHAHAHCMPDT
jgi:hypothetical protein